MAGTRGIRLIAATACALAFSVGTSQAAYPGSNGKIAFATGNGIAVVNPDGHGFKRLTRASDVSPAWSPDGRQIAFERQRAGGASEIWVMNADGSRARRVTAGGIDRHPTWSPDGSRLAIESDAAGAPAIYVTSVSGKAQRLLVAGRDPAWSPAGDRIAYVSSAAAPGDYPMGPRSSVWTVRPDGSGATRVRLSSYAEGPSWAPDARRIAFYEGSEIGASAWTRTAGAGALHELKAGGAVAALPAFSPDGRYLAFSLLRFDRRAPAALGIEDAATGRLRTLRLRGAGQVLGPDWQPARSR